MAGTPQVTQTATQYPGFGVPAFAAMREGRPASLGLLKTLRPIGFPTGKVDNGGGCQYLSDVRICHRPNGVQGIDSVLVAPSADGRIDKVFPARRKPDTTQAAAKSALGGGRNHRRGFPPASVT